MNANDLVDHLNFAIELAPRGAAGYVSVAHVGRVARARPRPRSARGTSPHLFTNRSRR